MKRILLWTAAGLVLLANGWAVLGHWRNRGEAVGGKLELTERELRLLAEAPESTVTALRLEWATEQKEDGEERFTPWLDAAKLLELGFDCRMPLDHPGARHHYNALPAKPAFLVLEAGGKAWKKTEAKGGHGSRLFVVDAGLQAPLLRQRYPDRQQFLICRGLVQLRYTDHRPPGVAVSPPQLRGWIVMLEPELVFAAHPQNRPLVQLLRAGGGDAHREPGEPRFTATLCSGANYEPWVEGIRLLDGAQGNPEKPAHQ
jgi:hypothetical protein